jgi:hypothetical protein
MRNDNVELLYDTLSYQALRRAGLSDALFTEAWHRADVSVLDDPDLREMSLTVDMGRVVGQTVLVQAPQISLTQLTLMATRRHKPFPSRVILADQLPDTQFVTLVGERKGDSWLLRTAYLGHRAPADIFDFNAIRRTRTSLRQVLGYWSTHAFVYRDDMFRDQPQTDTLLRIISETAKDRNPAVLEAIGYHQVVARVEMA